MGCFVKQTGKYILKNWFLIAVGCILTRKAVEAAYLERGYKAVGGEWLILPTILLFAEIARMMYWSIKEIFEMGDDEYDL